jgi:AraC-like DNA-binding protein
LQPISMSAPAASPDGSANQRINQVLTLINQRLPEVPAQSEVAQRVRMSPQAFSRFFKRCLGKTFIEYVNELRIGEVCRALLETEATITGAAYAAGFNNLSNFNEQFRHLKGMTPREYRDLALRKARETPSKKLLPQIRFGGSVRNARKLPPSIKLN